MVSMFEEKRELLMEYLETGEDISEVVRIPIPEYCRIPGITCFGVYHGLNKDPVPPPAKYAATAEKKVYGSWEMGELIKEAGLPLEKEGDALRICLLYLFLEEDNAGVIKGPETLYTDSDAHFLSEQYVSRVPAQTRDGILPPKAEQKGKKWKVTLSVFIQHISRILHETEISQRTYELSYDSFTEEGREQEYEESE